MTLEASHIQFTNGHTCSYVKNKLDMIRKLHSNTLATTLALWRLVLY